MSDDGYRLDDSLTEWLKGNAADCQAAGGCTHETITLPGGSATEIIIVPGDCTPRGCYAGDCVPCGDCGGTVHARDDSYAVDCGGVCVPCGLARYGDQADEYHLGPMRGY